MSTAVGHCERCESPLERGDLRCAICGAAVPEGGEAAATRVALQVLRCRGCGAAVAYDATHQAPACTFCESVLEVESIADPSEQTEAWLPFVATEAEARRGLARWMSGLGWFRPSDLVSASKLESLKPIWFVGWVFDAEALVSWAADSEVGSRRSAWAPHAGQTHMVFDDILVSASRGLTDAEVGALSTSYRLGDLRDAPEGPKDVTIEQFDVQRSQARRIVMDAAHRFAMSRVESTEVPGRRCRNLSVAILLEKLETRRFSFPAYVLTYRYGGQLYRTVVSGQDGDRVHGDSPISIAKVAIVAVAVVIVVLVVLAVLTR